MSSRNSVPPCADDTQQPGLRGPAQRGGDDLAGSPVGDDLRVQDELFRRDLGALPEALQDEVRRALLKFLDLS